MKTYFLKITWVCCFILIGQVLFAQIIPFEKDRWTIKANSVMLENYKGKNSVYIQGGMILLNEEIFENGIIEFDIYMSERVSFPGLAFRIKDESNYEEIYFRSHHSGHPDAYQYTPVYNGMSGWQIYHDLYTNDNNGLIGWKPVDEGMGYNGILDFAFDRWMHVKVVVAGTQAEMYFDGAEKPSVFIKELKQGTTAGQLGLKCGAGPTHFANFSFQKIDQPVLKSKTNAKTIAPLHIIRQWQVSKAFPEEELVDKKVLKKEDTINLTWQKLEAESGGLTNISKLHKRDKEANTVWAKLEIDSESDQIKSLDLGYSDRVKVYCNNRIIYSGNNGFRTRDYRYLGTIGYFDTVHLPLKKGKNTILVAVSENFGGWALQAKLATTEGLIIQ